MTTQEDQSHPNRAVRDDFVPAADYFSSAFADLEIEHLWPRVWQMACREEEIPRAGDFYTYDIVDDSIIVIRTGAEEIRAFHNACPHRGRRLTNGCGHTGRFHCRFHGWQFDLEGNPVRVVDREDWGDLLRDEDISLMEVKVDRWSGWVYINMDPGSESLDQSLAPIKPFLDPFDIAGLRYHWRKSTVVPCNWKTVLEAFNEGYHLQQTHPQLLRFTDDYTVSRTHGPHGQFGYWESLPPGFRSRRLGPPETSDIRPGLMAHVEEMIATINSTESISLLGAARRLLDEVPADTPVEEALMKVGQFVHEEAQALGIDLPVLTPEQQAAVGADWHVFPNQVFIPGMNVVLGYRARPNGRDINSAVFDVYSLKRYPPGQEPRVEPEWSDDLTDERFWGKILLQDFENLEDVQRGVKSRGFRGARTSPKQELAVSNFHRALREFIQFQAPQDNA